MRASSTPELLRYAEAFHRPPSRAKLNLFSIRSPPTVSRLNMASPALSTTVSPPTSTSWTRATRLIKSFSRATRRVLDLLSSSSLSFATKAFLSPLARLSSHPGSISHIPSLLS